METKKRQQEKQTAMESEIIDMSYHEWLAGLTEDEKTSLLPESVAKGKLEAAKMAALKTYFRKNLWQEEKAKINEKLVTVEK